MKKIFKTGLFISILISLIFLLSTIFEPKNNLKEYGMREVEANAILAEKEQTLDVLFVGDSEAYSSFIPANIWHDYGITSYVSATSGQYLYETINYVSKVIEKQQPKVIILETNALFRNFNQIDPFLNKVYNTASIFQYHDLWKSFNPKNLHLKKEYTYINDAKGYRFNASVKASSNLDYMKYSSLVKEVSKTNVNHLKELIDLASKIDAKVILVSTPSTVNYNYQKHNGISKLARELNLEYIDLNLVDLSIDWKQDTRDAGDHLNFKGAKKVTDFIGKYLNDLKLFSDKRMDQEYSKWHKSYDNFMKVVRL